MGEKQGRPFQLSFNTFLKVRFQMSPHGEPRWARSRLPSLNPLA
jgi:hypothetical protein